MLVRREVAVDAEAVDAVHAAAFGQRVEPDLAAALRDAGEVIPALCWVAEVDGRVVGSVICSRGDLDGLPAVGLGPIGVLPELQARGAGSALVHAAIGAADATDEPFIALLGAPADSGRYGVETTTAVGVAPPEAAWGAHFQVRTLSAFRPTMRGTFRYAAAFDDV